MRWKFFRGAVLLLCTAALPLVATRAAAAETLEAPRLSAVDVTERDSVLEIAFALSGEVDYRLGFSDGAVRMTLSPVLMTAGRQVFDVNHPLFSRVVVRPAGANRVNAWLLTDRFDARQLEGAVRVLSTDAGLRLVVGQELLSSAPGKSGVVGAVGEASSPEASKGAASNESGVSFFALRDNLPGREAIAVMAAMLVASLMGGVLARSLMVRRRAAGIVRVCSGVNVGSGRRVLLVEVDGCRLLVGVEPAGMRLIADLDQEMEAQPVEPVCLSGDVPKAPRFVFADTDVRLRRGRRASSRPDQKQLEIAS